MQVKRHRIVWLGIVFAVATGSMTSPAADNAAKILARRLGQAQDSLQTTLVLRDIAQLGARGREAGEDVLPLMDDENWDTRVLAARTLGFIDYQPSVPRLVKALDEPADVRLNWVAAESLGRLHNVAANDALQRASSQHWYPPVRRTAKEAIEHIRAASPYAPRYSGLENFPLEYFAYEGWGRGEWDCGTPQPSNPARQSSPGWSLPMGRGYERQVEQGPGEKPMVVRLIPDVVLRVANGWLAGSDRGEFGGELVFLGDDGSQHLIVETDVQNVVALGGRTIAVTGLAHMFFNNGVLLEVSRRAGGPWVASPWRRLPGAPGKSWLTTTGELLVDVYRGGTILVAPDGSMRVASCPRRR